MSKKVVMIVLLSLSVLLTNITFAAVVVSEAKTPVAVSNDQTQNQTVSAAQAVVNKSLNEPISGDQEMPLPATGWLLFFSLIGFVLLSNRQNI